MNLLNGKIAIVTGGGSGIGRGIAEALGKHGVQMAVCGRRFDRLKETVEAIQKHGGTALAVKADISQEEDVDTLIQETISNFGHIDILVNNAGVYGGDEVHQSSVEEWDRIMAVNLRAPFLLVRAVLPKMRGQRSGHIINISSESGIEYYKGDAIYGLSKHALNDFGEYVQRENQDYNIRVNTICPGMVVTEMTEKYANLDHSKCLYPEDIADLVIFLLTRRPHIKISSPILIQTMENPWLSNNS